jgi:predicted HicB family RNase H-like nuclease
MMEYKGYVGQAELDDEANIFHGEVINTRDVITFQGETVEELRQAFRDSVDGYLAFCEERGREPEKPFSGQFITRVSPELHRRVNVAAKVSGQSLNAFVTQALQTAVSTVQAFPPYKRTSMGTRGSSTGARTATGKRKAAL